MLSLNEAERADAMRAHDAHTLFGDPQLSALTDFAAALCGTAIAMVSLVEEHRQWFPARTGIDASETPRPTSLCAHAMLGDDVMIVTDAGADPRFAANPMVTGDPHIRFYAGMPLVADDGTPFGALCVIDRTPRAGLTALQRQGLHVLAGNVMGILNARREAKAQRAADRAAQREIAEQDQRFRILADAMPQMVWSTQPDGFHDYYNARWYDYTGMPAGSTDGEGWNGMFHPDDQARAWDIWRHSLTTGEPYEIEYRLRNAAGEYRWTLGRALPMRAPDGTIMRWFGTCTDIHEQKLIQEQREIISHELSHRIKNIFSVIGGLIMFSTQNRPEMKEGVNDLRERIMALGRAHDFVRPHSDMSRSTKRQTSLLGMLEELLAPYQATGGTRISIIGDDPDIDDRSATPLALLFHELATNAAKYGALSVPDGHVRIDIIIGEGTVRLGWTETGGPLVAAPEQTGFGSRLIELSVVRQLGGTLLHDWKPSGLALSLTVPQSAMHRIIPAA